MSRLVWAVIVPTLIVSNIDIITETYGYNAMADARGVVVMGVEKNVENALRDELQQKCRKSSSKIYIIYTVYI